MRAVRGAADTHRYGSTGTNSPHNYIYIYMWASRSSMRTARVFRTHPQKSLRARTRVGRGALIIHTNDICVARWLALGDGTGGPCGFAGACVSLVVDMRCGVRIKLCAGEIMVSSEIRVDVLFVSCCVVCATCPSGATKCDTQM